MPVVTAQIRRHGFHDGHGEYPLFDEVFADPGLQYTLPPQDDPEFACRQIPAAQGGLSEFFPPVTLSEDLP